MVLAAAAELPPLQLDDALEVLALMANQSPPERLPRGSVAVVWRLAPASRARL